MCNMVDYLGREVDTTILISLLLMAINYLSGYLKDVIIETLYGNYNISGYIMSTAFATLNCNI